MVQTFKQYVDGYAEKGLINKEAYIIARGTPHNETMDAWDEFALDACAYVNDAVGSLISNLRGLPNPEYTQWEYAVKTAVKRASELWSSHGMMWGDNAVEACSRYVSDYIMSCFHARLRGMFRNNQSMRARLYAALARRGFSRSGGREALDACLGQLWAEHHDGEYTDDVLDALVDRCLKYGVIRAN